MKKVVLFLDDFRRPALYVDRDTSIIHQAFCYDDFVERLESLYKKYGKIDIVWFDHDLGYENEKNGYDCAKYLVEFCEEHNMPLPEYHIQSNNPAGSKNIDSYLKSYIKSKTL